MMCDKYCEFSLRPLRQTPGPQPPGLIDVPDVAHPGFRRHIVGTPACRIVTSLIRYPCRGIRALALIEGQIVSITFYGGDG